MKEKSSRTAYDIMTGSLAGRLFLKTSNGESSPFPKDTVLIYNNLRTSEPGQSLYFISISHTRIQDGGTTLVDLNAPYSQFSLKGLAEISVKEAREKIPDLEAKLEDAINSQGNEASHTGSPIPKLNYQELTLPKGLKVNIK